MHCHAKGAQTYSRACFVVCRHITLVAGRRRTYVTSSSCRAMSLHFADNRAVRLFLRLTLRLGIVAKRCSPAVTQVLSHASFSLLQPMKLDLADGADEHAAFLPHRFLFFAFQSYFGNPVWHSPFLFLSCVVFSADLGQIRKANTAAPLVSFVPPAHCWYPSSESRSDLC